MHRSKTLSLIILGALSFWGPRLIIGVLLPSADMPRVLTIVLPICFACVIACLLIIRRSMTSGPSVAMYMLIGVWLAASTAIVMVAASRAQSDAAPFAQIVASLALGLIPVYALVMSTYDGTLFALIAVSVIAVVSWGTFERRSWIVPPAIRRWFLGRRDEK